MYYSKITLTYKMSGITIIPIGNKKSSIWFNVTNKSHYPLDISATNRTGESLRVGYGDFRVFQGVTIEIEPNEAIKLRIAPNANNKMWISNQIIIIRFVHNGETFERTYVTGSRGQLGHFITARPLVPPIGRGQDDNQENEENGEDEEGGDEEGGDDEGGDDEDEDNQEDDIVEVSDDPINLEEMQQTLNTYSQLRSKVNTGNASIETLRNKVKENRKRLLDMQTELEKEENELQTAIEICSTVEQEFKKIKSTIEKKT
jgi:hypothetical protein